MNKKCSRCGLVYERPDVLENMKRYLAIHKNK